MIEKTCCTCGATKPVSMYTRSKANKDGLGKRCRACDQAKSAAFRAKHGIADDRLPPRPRGTQLEDRRNVKAKADLRQMGAA